MKKILLASVALAAVGPARAFADLNFDATTVEPDTGFEVIPPGWYNVAIDESTMKPTKDGLGTYLELRFDVLDGQYAKRKLFARFNLKNSSAQAVEIAQKQLSAVCHAVGVLRPQKSEELHGIPLKAKVKVRAAQGDYEASNEFTAYKNINEQVDQAGPTPPGNAGLPAGGGTEAPPSQPWVAPPAASMANESAPPADQPWAAPAAEAPPAAPAAPDAAPPAPQPHDPIAAAEKDGWIKHPSSPDYHYRGQEVLLTKDLAGRTEYSAPAAEAPPAAPAAPPAAPEAPAADGTQAAPPWAKPQ